MKLLSQVGIVCSLIASIQSADVKVYKFPQSNGKSFTGKVSVPTLKSNDAILNLANQFGVSSNFDLDKLQDPESLAVGQDIYFGDEETLDRQELILIVQGVVSESFLQDETPIFTVDQQSKDFQKFLSNLPNEFNDEDDQLNQLSENINIIESKSKDHANSNLEQIWSHYFAFTVDLNHKLKDIWEDLKIAFRLTQDDTDKSINLINDQSYINELSQFKFLVEDAQVQCSKIVVNLKSLAEILKKTGQSSKTYQNSLNILENLINQNLINNVNNKFKTTIVVLPSISTLDFISTPTVQHLHRRDSLAAAATSSASSNANCFLSEESCLISTSSCSNHGVCAKSNDCWSCTCSASYNDTTSWTTYWQGADCSKKDISSQFNLLVWFSVFMTVATVLGVKLLFDVGNEELPGVLSAATASKKSNA